MTARFLDMLKRNGVSLAFAAGYLLTNRKQAVEILRDYGASNTGHDSMWRIPNRDRVWGAGKNLAGHVAMSLHIRGDA